MESDDGGATAQAMSAAERRCERRGERLTTPRRRVLQLLLEAKAPLKAYDLVARYDRDGTPATPTTVYRALEFLDRVGLVHRIESLSAYVACRLAEPAHNVGFLICDRCGAVQEFAPELPDELAAARSARYAVETITVEAHGVCAACRAN
jgi:Fur family zinc uptake transcriptional regulator